ncbi:MAG TPA: ATP-binding protein [Selenomonadales bacterium]|nr:ATP-binding protein [Selenomonadales bacterium]
MQHHLPQHYFSRLWRAIIEFDLIQENDKILVGLSGGKDSLFLTYALSIIRRHSPRPFEVAAITLDPMFTADFDTAPLAGFCAGLGVAFHATRANIAAAIENNNGKDPCFVCSYFRRAVINHFAVDHGFNKIAYAHHHDDAVETFLMGLLYTGQLKTFLPKTHLDRTGLTVIRPLVYFREKELRITPRLHGFTPLPSPCPLDGKTKRQEAKDMIREWGQTNKHVFSHLAAAMRESPATELWPAPLSRPSMKEKHHEFWRKK